MILASKSPRRLEILKNFGIRKIKIVPPDVEEVSDKIGLKEQIIDIAIKKGKEISKENPNEYVLSADTIVILGEVLLGKPKDREEAFKMLESLSGRTHRVVTGYSLINMNEEVNISGYGETIVRFKEISEDDIWWYINTGEPMDKAGSYGIQGVGAGILIEEIQGEFYNVMGFPISKFVEELKKRGLKVEDIVDL